MSFSILNFVQKRTTTFFTKVSAATLWKTTTSCRAGGKKKGRMRAFRKPKDLNRGQTLGEGPVNMQWAGLNTPIIQSQTLLQHKYLKPDPHRVERLLQYRKEQKLIGRAKKLHPMERGYSGPGLQGRKVDIPNLPGEDNLKDFTAICLRTKSVNVMVTRGRLRLHNCIVAMGNYNGLLGYGFAKAKTPRSALRKAVCTAPQRLQYIHRLDDHTVYHDFFAQCCGVRIFVERKPKGFGLRCHRVIKSLCELCGITDLRAKVDGEVTNYMNITKAFMVGLLNQETHEELAERKRLHVVEFRRENGYLPKVVASPQANAPRTSAEIGEQETLDVEDMYGEAKLPFNKPTFPTPFFLTMAHPGYRRKVFLEHPYRNMYGVMIRLMAEEKLRDMSIEAKEDEAKKAHEKVLMGEAPMPIGLALPGIFRDSLIDDEDGKSE